MILKVECEESPLCPPGFWHCRVTLFGIVLWQGCKKMGAR